jgi:phosphatidylglycerol---prolipoprotein diacylglyceryl transferase
VPSLATIVVYPHPFLIRFSEHAGIRFYGLAYLGGFLIALWLFRRYHQAGRTALTPAQGYDLMLALVVGVIVGGRLGYFLLYQPDWLFRDPMALLRVWEGGMASHGGMIGVALALWWFGRSTRIPFLHLGDLVVSTAPAGLFLGRVANFLNGELWGRSALVPWAMKFPLSDPHAPEKLLIPRHPSQLYEAALEGILLFVLMQWRFWKTDVMRRTPGRLSGEFLLAYAAVRAFCELFREPDEGITLILGLSRGTFYSIFLVGAGLALIAFSRRGTGSAKG